MFRNFDQIFTAVGVLQAIVGVLLLSGGLLIRSRRPIVRSVTIPEDKDVAAETPEQVAQEVTGLQLADVVVVKLEEEIQAPAPGGDGDARDRRDPVAPIEVVHQRRLSHRSPRLGDGRGQEEPRFIGENEVGAQPGDVFFTCGQSSRKNLPMLFSSLSRARLLGFWWLQPRLCISRPT